MHKVLLDSDILSELYKSIDKNIINNASLYLDWHPCLSFTSMSVYEILYGLKAKQATKQINRFLSDIAEHEEIIPSTQDYRLAADIRAAMHLSGTEIGRADPIIAACAINRQLILSTGNTRHYNYIASAGFSLTIVNWRE